MLEKRKNFHSPPLLPRSKRGLKNSKDTSRNGTIIDEEDVQFGLPLLVTLSDEKVLEDIMTRELFQILGFSLPAGVFDVEIDRGRIEFEILKEEKEEK